MFDLLRGTRVVEFGLLLNGCQLGMQLSSLGADVLKIEDAIRGDYIRDILGQITPHNSPAHLQANKNKKSLAIDAKQPEGLEIIREILRSADIFVDGLRPGVCDALGIGYEAQKAANPRIVYTHYTGYGATGPYASVPTHGYQMTALAGGFPARIADDGQPVPVRGVQYMGGTEDSSSPSSLGAHYAAMATLAAIIRRDREGVGAYIDVAATDAVLATSWMGLVYNLNYDRITEFKALAPKRAEYSARWPEGSARYQLYSTKDAKLLLIGVLEQKFWKKFCLIGGRPDLVNTMRPNLEIDYGEDKPWLRDEVAKIVGDRTVLEWMDVAAREGLPLAPANRIEDLASDPQIRARNLIVEAQLEGVGSFSYVDFPAVIPSATSSAPTTAPSHGQHSAEVLAGMGLDADRIADLARRGIVTCGSGDAID